MLLRSFLFMSPAEFSATYGTILYYLLPTFQNWSWTILDVDWNVAEEVQLFGTKLIAVSLIQSLKLIRYVRNCDQQKTAGSPFKSSGPCWQESKGWV